MPTLSRVLCPQWLLFFSSLLLSLIAIDHGVGWLGRTAAQLLVFGALALLMLGVERLAGSRLAALILTPLLLVATYIAAFDAGSRWGAGSPMQLSSLMVGLRRFEDVRRAAIAELGAPLFYAMLLAPLLMALAGGIGVLLARAIRGRPGRLAAVAGVVTITALALLAVSPVNLRTALATNVYVRLGLQFGMQGGGRQLTADTLTPRSADGQEETDHAGAVGNELNVLLVVLESTGTTNIVRDGQIALPNLGRIASSGLVSLQMRVPIPHTSKALFALLCSDYPAVNTAIVEAAANFPRHCIAERLGSHGYRSLFIQSADGSFERRPALIDNAGFDDFLAFQNRSPRTPRAAYISASEEPMIDAVTGWVGASDQPFFVTLLTSLTHHPYIAAEDTPHSGEINQMSDPHARYEALVGLADRFLGQLLQALARAGKLERTIVVVVGDHGESFAQGEARQHDNVWREDSLKVPFIMAGPGVPRRELSGPRSLLDVGPTIVDALELPHWESAEGVSLLDTPPPSRQFYSASWFEDYWSLAVRWPYKVLVWHGDARIEVFDLSSSEPSRALDEPPAATDSIVADVERWRDAQRVDEESARFPQRTMFDDVWACRDRICWYTPTGEYTLDIRDNRLEDAGPDEE